VSILLIDDHALVRAGVKRLLATVTHEDILECADGRDALAVLRQGRIKLVILDLNLPGLGGLELLQRIIQMGAGPVLVLSMHAEPIYIRRALDAGAAGYVTKNVSPDELVTAVTRVLAGGRYVEAELAQALAIQGSAAHPGLSILAPRELEIMRLLGEGFSLAEIAEAVGVGYKTVANSCSEIKAKLGVSRTADLVRLALATGLN
jgi:two-component system invasion response regulator UvrY